MQPSMLLGERKEKRIMERIAKAVMIPVSAVLAGSLSKYKAIHGKTIARAMLTASKQESPGVHRYQYDELKKLAE
jgi:cell division protein FtsB